MDAHTIIRRIALEKLKEVVTREKADLLSRFQVKLKQFILTSKYIPDSLRSQLLLLLSDDPSTQELRAKFLYRCQLALGITSTVGLVHLFLRSASTREKLWRAFRISTEIVIATKAAIEATKVYYYLTNEDEWKSFKLKQVERSNISLAELEDTIQQSKSAKMKFLISYLRYRLFASNSSSSSQLRTSSFALLLWLVYVTKGATLSRKGREFTFQYFHHYFPKYFPIQPALPAPTVLVTSMPNPNHFKSPI